MSGRLMGRRLLYVAAEKDALYLHALRNRFLRTPNVTVQRLDPEVAQDFTGLENCFDTVLCMNVLEYAEDPASLIDRLRISLKPNGNVLILVPQNPHLFGSLDRNLGHKRRFTREEIGALLQARGFAVEKTYNFNKAGAVPWWAYAGRSGKRRIRKPLLKIFDKTVWLWRRLDPIMPWPGLSLIVVARRTDGSANPVAEWELKQTSTN
jgi:SAM-dependent methyltransferase